MIFFAESLLLFALFYLIGSLELRGKVETRARAFTPRSMIILFAALLLTGLNSHNPLSGESDLIYLFAGLTALLAVITLLDMETKMLSDALTVILGLGGLGYAWMSGEVGGDIWPSVGLGIGLGLMGAFLAGPYSKWRKQEMLGWGDVKFFAAAGLWLVPLQLPVFLAIAGIVGTVNALIYRAATGRAETPFAPALCVALWLCAVYGFSL